MIKSLQSKMILVMFIFILLIILFSAFFSIIKMEQVYYRGFIQEMLNTISSFGIHIDNPIIELDEVGEQKKPQPLDIDKIKNNFDIYFSLNSNMRHGTILDENFQQLYSSKSQGLTSGEIQTVTNSISENGEYTLINDNEANEYYFIFYIKQNGNIKYTLVIEQDKTYINSQMREVTIFYLASMIILSIITIAISALLASNVTKPIEFIRKKAQLIAAR